MLHSLKSEQRGLYSPSLGLNSGRLPLQRQYRPRTIFSFHLAHIKCASGPLSFLSLQVPQSVHPAPSDHTPTSQVRSHACMFVALGFFHAHVLRVCPVGFPDVAQKYCCLKCSSEQKVRAVMGQQRSRLQLQEKVEYVLIKNHFFTIQQQLGWKRIQKYPIFFHHKYYLYFPHP